MPRLNKELVDIQKNVPDGFSDIVCNEVITKWEVKMTGPPNTPYESGIFRIEIHFPDYYPFKPPSVWFLTPIFHPNISTLGHVCLNILHLEEWSPSLTVSIVLTSIRTLLTIPNADHPFNEEAATLLRSDINAFNTKAQQLTQHYARNNSN